jgi:catechol 2,3-dioxygenase-like lactoylglutathione lyase family enzyme
MDMKLEVVVVPVTDVDRAKDFYATTLGWRVDADIAPPDGTRLVQLTPPSSGCSVQFGKGITLAEPGSLQDLYLIVSDIELARKELTSSGVAVSEVFHCENGFVCRFESAGAEGRVAGRAAEGRSYFSFAKFSDPDGNGWVLQEITERLPGR